MDCVKTYREILNRDTAFAERGTMCKRCGVAARLVWWNDDIMRTSTVVINGSNFCTGVKGSCGCAHAEAILIVRILLQCDPIRNADLLCTFAPCTQCAHLIVESDIIDRVFYLRAYHDSRGLQTLQRSLIQAEQLK